MARKLIRVEHDGNAGNRMFQYLFCRALQRLVPGAALVGAAIPPWVETRRDIADPARHCRIEGGHDFDLAAIAYLLNAGLVDGVTCRVFAQRMAYLPSPGAARAMLRRGFDARLGRRVPADALLINIRSAEIMDGAHPDYMPLPWTFYDSLVARTGLRPIFMGQIGDGPYFESLRRHFPQAPFWDSGGPLRDFNTIAQARHVVVSISTFSWLAAWMSPVARRVFLPVCGLFNPAQRPDIDLLPHDDARYRCFGFPVLRWRGTDAQRATLLAGGPPGAVLSPEAVAAMKLECALGTLVAGQASQKDWGVSCDARSSRDVTPQTPTRLRRPFVIGDDLPR